MKFKFLIILLLLGCSAPQVEAPKEPPKVQKESPAPQHPFAKLARGECPCPDGDYVLLIHKEEGKTSIVCAVKGSNSEREHRLHMDSTCCESGDRVTPEKCPELFGK